MVIERVGTGRDDRVEWARVGRVEFSKTGKTLYYDGRVLRGNGMSWYSDTATGESFIVRRAPRRFKGRSSLAVEIDENVRVEFWTTIREEPNRSHERTVRAND